MLTPEQTQDLVDHFGGLRPASRAVGIHNTTLWYWLNPERKRKRERERYRQNPEAKRAAVRERYENFSGVEYNRRLLQMRRVKALHRRRQRLTEEAD